VGGSRKAWQLRAAASGFLHFSQDEDDFQSDLIDGLHNFQDEEWFTG